jgi:hypothetical protein
LLAEPLLARVTAATTTGHHDPAPALAARQQDRGPDGLGVRHPLNGQRRMLVLAEVALIGRPVIAGA